MVTEPVACAVCTHTVAMGDLLNFTQSRLLHGLLLYWSLD